MPPSDHILEDVSRETIEQLQIYMGLLRKWQSKINLVSPQTLDEAWKRRVLDPWTKNQSFEFQSLTVGTEEKSIPYHSAHWLQTQSTAQNGRLQ